MRGSRIVFVWVILFVAALAVAIVPLVAHLRQSGRTHDRIARGGSATQPGDDADVAGFEGEIETARGTRISVRVARLHAVDKQQKFDANALARRFGLGAGEPFVCEIRARGEGDVAPDALRSIAIRDERGEALAPFPPATTTAQGPNLGTEPMDPLATLLSPPSEALRPGFAVSVILWGRAPESGAHLSGLADVDLALAPTHLASRDLDPTLARIDAAGAVATGAPK